ncbi:hypothetical protein MPSEU_001077800 [Mayamaea pseudoterrestris]|nr:hypothetical protein MPSEU_001077800 [Mayamaea pseudoterrestris]
MSSKGSGNNKRSCVQLQDEDLGRLDGLNEDEKNLETKRAYNRKIAARARQRTKDMVEGLSEQVAMHMARNKTLEQAKKDLSNKVNSLEEENLLLRQCILDPSSVSPESLVRLGLMPMLRTAAHLVAPASVSSSEDTSTSNKDQQSLYDTTHRPLHQQSQGFSDDTMGSTGSQSHTAATAAYTTSLSSMQQQQQQQHYQQHKQFDLQQGNFGGAGQQQQLPASFLAPSSTAPMPTASISSVPSQQQLLAAIGLHQNALGGAATAGNSSPWPGASEQDRQNMLLLQLLRSAQQQSPQQQP